MSGRPPSTGPNFSWSRDSRRDYSDESRSYRGRHESYRPGDHDSPRDGDAYPGRNGYEQRRRGSQPDRRSSPARSNRRQSPNRSLGESRHSTPPHQLPGRPLPLQRSKSAADTAIRESPVARGNVLHEASIARRTTTRESEPRNKPLPSSSAEHTSQDACREPAANGARQKEPPPALPTLDTNVESVKNITSSSDMYRAEASLTMESFTSALMSFAEVVSTRGAVLMERSVAERKATKAASEDEENRKLPKSSSHQFAALLAHSAQMRESADAEVARLDTMMAKKVAQQQTLAKDLGQLFFAQSRPTQHDLTSMQATIAEVKERVLLLVRNENAREKLDGYKKGSVRVEELQDKINDTQDLVNTWKADSHIQLPDGMGLVTLKQEILRLNSVVKDLQHSQRPVSESGAAATISAVNQIKALDSDIGSLRVNVDNHSKALKIQISAYNDQLKSMSDDIGALRSQIQHMQEHFTPEQFSKLGSELEQLHSIQDEMTEAVGQEMQAMKEDLQQLKNTVSEQSKMLGNQQKDMSSVQPLNERSDAIEQETKAMKSDLLQLRNTVSEQAKLLDEQRTARSSMLSSVQADITRLSIEQMDVAKHLAFLFNAHSTTNHPQAIQGNQSRAIAVSGILPRMGVLEMPLPSQIRATQQAGTTNHGQRGGTDFGAAIQGLQSKLTSQENLLQALNTACRMLDKRYNNLTTEHVVQAMSQSMHHMYPFARNANEEISAMRGRLDEMKKNGSDAKLHQEVTAFRGLFEGHLETTKSSITDLQDQVAKVEKSLDESLKQNEGNVQHMRETKSRFESQFSSMDERVETVETFKDKLESLRNQLGSLRDHVDNTTGSIDDKTSTRDAEHLTLWASIDTRVKNLERYKSNLHRSTTPELTKENGGKVNGSSYHGPRSTLLATGNGGDSLPSDEVEEFMTPSTSRQTSSTASTKKPTMTKPSSVKGSSERTVNDQLTRAHLVNKKRKAPDEGSDVDDGLIGPRERRAQSKKLSLIQ